MGGAKALSQITLKRRAHEHDPRMEKEGGIVINNIPYFLVQYLPLHDFLPWIVSTLNSKFNHMKLEDLISLVWFRNCFANWGLHQSKLYYTSASGEFLCYMYVTSKAKFVHCIDVIFFAAFSPVDLMIDKYLQVVLKIKLQRLSFHLCRYGIILQAKCI